MHNASINLLPSGKNLSLAVMKQEVADNCLNDECSDHDTLHRNAQATLLATEVKRIPQVLQFPIVIQGSRPAAVCKPELSEKLHFLRRRAPTKGTIPKEFL